MWSEKLKTMKVLCKAIYIYNRMSTDAYSYTEPIYFTQENWTTVDKWYKVFDKKNINSIDYYLIENDNNKLAFVSTQHFYTQQEHIKRKIYKINGEK